MLKRFWARICSQDFVVVANVFVAEQGDNWGGGGGGGGVVGVELMDLCSWAGGKNGMFVSMWRACLRAVSSNFSSSEFFEYTEEGEDGARE